MKNRFHLAFLVLTAMSLAACGRTNIANNPFAPSPSASAPANPTTAASPSPSAPIAIPSKEASPSTAPSPQASAPANGNGQTYKQPQGLFEVSFPQGYTYQETNSGITFASGDN
ncbi:MAG: hypothetical protein F6K28_47665, partial [Microcoleus sp. SIO2G3]|nr:hypothetical protein [Microcoleus sp. SIO2G3]